MISGIWKKFYENYQKKLHIKLHLLVKISLKLDQKWLQYSFVFLKLHLQEKGSSWKNNCDFCSRTVFSTNSLLSLVRQCASFFYQKETVLLWNQKLPTKMYHLNLTVQKNLWLLLLRTPGTREKLSKLLRRTKLK